jgi:putative addiction module killer protein
MSASGKTPPSHCFLELRISIGSGYRVYFAEDGPAVVLLLIGGDKSSQVKDIKIAKRYWQQYREGAS